MSDVLTFLSSLDTAAKSTVTDLQAVSSAAAAAANATAGMTGGAGGSGGMGATPGQAGGPNATGGYTHGSGATTTVHAIGPGLPADVISALRSLGGR